MQDMILTITITIQISVPPMPPTPAGARKPEPVSTKRQVETIERALKIYLQLGFAFAPPPW